MFILYMNINIINITEQRPIISFKKKFYNPQFRPDRGLSQKYPYLMIWFQFPFTTGDFLAHNWLDLQDGFL